MTERAAVASWPILRVWQCLRLASLCAVLAASGCGGGDGGGGDVTPPGPTNNAPPTNVRLVEVSSMAVGEVTASWLPAADDSAPVSSLRYQLHASTDKAFAPSSSTLRFETSGQLSGSISGALTPGERYFVRLVALDQQGASTVGDIMSVTVTDTAATRLSGVTTRVLQASEVSQVGPDSITLTGTTASPQIGTFIASDAGAGYLRQVTGVSTVSGSTVLNTRTAALNEVVSGVQVSSSVRMPLLPAQTVASSRENALGVRVTSVDAVSSKLSWPAGRMTYSAGAGPDASARKRTLDVRRQISALVPRFEAGPSTTETGKWASVTGQNQVGLEEGATGTLVFSVSTIGVGAPMFGSQVSICAIEAGAQTNADPLVHPGDMNIGMLGSMEKTGIDAATGRVVKATRSLQIGATSKTASAEPYLGGAQK